MEPMAVPEGLHRAIVVLAAVVLCCARAAPGLIISTDQDLADTASDGGFPYWGNVGWRGLRTGSNSDGSCIYLGRSWVLTANHVGAGNVTLNGVEYAYISGTVSRIASADAKVFRIANPPADLQPVTIYADELATGTDVRMLGTGLDQDPTRTYWRLTGGGTVWEETTQHNADASGFYWSDPPVRVKRWGTNRISDVYTSGGNYFFQTSFDRGDTTYEANAADKDSGGAVFVNTGATWQLAGISVGLSTWMGQPAAAVDWVSWSSTTSGNSTVMVDLTRYRDEIIAKTPQPKPIPGDLNHDDFVGEADLDIVLSSWGQHVTPGATPDPSGDGFVGQADLDIVLSRWGSGTPPP
jgi:hypothetical protein